MLGNNDLSSWMRDDALHRDGFAGREVDSAANGDEDACPAFGFLRGLDATALTLEIRPCDRNSEWFSYSCLTSFRFNPSVGLLLKFSGDVTSLVLLHGSNLDAPVGEAKVNLTDRGLQRHRIVYIREMSEIELRRAREGEPTIDHIDIGEFESLAEQREWLAKVAPLFVREQG